MNYLNLKMFKLIVIFGIFWVNSVVGQGATTPTIIFSVSTTQRPRPPTPPPPPPPPPPPTRPPTPAPQPGCRCVPYDDCPTIPTGIDIRIVNTPQPSCRNGEIWCCGLPSELRDPACGIRKITNSPPQENGAKYGAYPWQVALLTMDNMYIGSGVLIGDEYVLTVAHKVVAFPKGNFKLRLGDWNGQSTNEPNPYVEFRPVAMVIHPNFNSKNLQHDVAVIRLSGTAPIKTAPNINTACLPTTMPPTGTRCFVSGWGKNSFGSDGRYQAMLKEVDVPIVDQGSCESRLRATRLGRYFVLDKTSFICAGGESGKDACTGDGGGPLVCQTNTGQFQVNGLVAWGIGCATSGVPGVYVNVVNYLSWINQQIAALEEA